MGQKAEEIGDRKSNGSRQKSKRGDCKVESNDSREISDSGEKSDIPSLPSRSQLGPLEKLPEVPALASDWLRCSTPDFFFSLSLSLTVRVLLF